MTKAEYISNALQVLEKYIDDVKNDKIVCSIYEKQKVARFLEFKQKYIYKESELVKVINFFFYLKIKIGSQYRRFELLDFQVFWLANLYSLYINDGERLFNEAFISMSKKQGKTVFNSALALYELMYDKEVDASVVLLATKTDQANYALKYCKGIINNSPYITNKLEVNRKNIYYLRNPKMKTTSATDILEIKSADSDGIQGGNISFNLVDEIFYHKELELKENAKSAMAERTNPLQVCIGTIGDNVNYPAFELLEKNKRILAGEAEDDRLFIAIYQLDYFNEDGKGISDLENPKAWRKSNPALGQTVKLDFLLSEFQAAKNSPSKKAIFQRDNLNFYTDNLTTWISTDDIKKQMVKGLNIPEGQDIYIGLDLSATRDLTSIAVLWRGDDNKFYSKNFFIFPDNPKNLIKKGSIDLTRWIEQGYIIKDQAKTVSEETILTIIRELNDKYNIKSIGADPWNTRILLQRVENEFNIDIATVNQNTKYLGFPLKFMEAEILNERHFFDYSPVMIWNFYNVKIFTDSNGNIKIMKKAGESVDGCVALNIAYQRWVETNFDSEDNNIQNYLKMIQNKDEK